MFATTVPPSSGGDASNESTSCERLPAPRECPRTLADTPADKPACPRDAYIEAAEAFLDAFAALRATRLSCFLATAALA
jgi:hypothetical protein